jgi:CRP/FNR family transcriptional regulator
MTSLNKITDLRRPIAINLANRVAASACDDCGARRHGLCEALSDDEVSFLSRVAQHISLPANSVFIEEGEPAAYFYNVNSGNVRLFKSLPDGRRQITGFAGTGHFLGLAATAKNVFSAETMEPARLCRFSRASMAAVFEEFPVLERKLLDVAMHELVLNQQQILLLGRKTAIERIASFLLSWAVRQDVCASGTLPKPHSSMQPLRPSRARSAS